LDGCAGELGNVNRHKSIKESMCVQEHAVLLKPIYKYYQAMQFASNSAHFQWDSNHHQRCVQMLIDAAKECHNTTDYNRGTNVFQGTIPCIWSVHKRLTSYS
jgi:hypothetical protein